MKTNFKYPGEFLFSIFSLIACVIIMQGLYVTWIRPTAEQMLEQEYAQVRNDPTVKPGRSIYVIIKDYEQETCIILMLWSLTLLAYKTFVLSRDRRLLDA